MQIAHSAKSPFHQSPQPGAFGLRSDWRRIRSHAAINNSAAACVHNHSNFAGCARSTLESSICCDAVPTKCIIMLCMRNIYADYTWCCCTHTRTKLISDAAMTENAFLAGVYIVSWRRKRMHSNTFSRKRPFTFYNHLVRELSACLAWPTSHPTHTSLSYLTQTRRQPPAQIWEIRYMFKKPVFTPISVGCNVLFSDGGLWDAAGHFCDWMRGYASDPSCNLCAGFCILGDEFYISKNEDFPDLKHFMIILNHM